MATGSRKALAYSVRDVPGTNRGVNAASGFSESLVLFPSNFFRNCFPKKLLLEVLDKYKYLSGGVSHSAIVTWALRCQVVAIRCQAVDGRASNASTVWRQVATEIGG
jgi:hypothetical protein